MPSTSTIVDLTNVFAYYVLQIKNAGFRNVLNALDTEQVTVTVANVTYNPPLTGLVGQTDFLATSSFANDSDADDSQAFNETQTFTASFSTATTQGLKLGASSKVQTGIPFLAEGEVTLSAETNLGSTNTNMSTVTQTFSIQTTINVPAKTTINVSLTITRIPYAGRLTAEVQLGGRLRYGLGGNFKTVAIVDLFTAVSNALGRRETVQFADGAGNQFTVNAPDLALFQVSGTQVTYQAAATVSATFGANERVTVEQDPPPSSG